MDKFLISKKPPPTRKLRRDLQREIVELKRQLADAEEKARQAAVAGAGAGRAGETPPIEKVKKWEEAEKLLPKDGKGVVNWNEALEKKVISPRPGIAADAAEGAVFKFDVKLESSPLKDFHVSFSHEPHTRWLSCGNCHPAIFPLGKGKPIAVTMAKIQAGEYCGACHGKVAFGVTETCARCHTSPSIPARAEWTPEPPRNAAEQARTWDQAAKLLPKDAAGAVDWAKAVQEKVIAPRPGIDPKAADQPVLPVEVELATEGNPSYKAIFPHQAHTAVLGCANCHPALFQMARGADRVTMQKIYAGEACGACHGKVAFAPATGCARCHAKAAIPARAEWKPPEPPRNAAEQAGTWDQAAKLLPKDAAGMVDWAKAVEEKVIAPRPGIDLKAADQPVLPVDVEMADSGNPAFKAIFPHKAHTAVLGCMSCHPALFQMARGTSKVTMNKIYAGESCGACHGKVAFAPATGCARCHPNLAKK